MARSKHFMPEDFYLSPTDCHLAKLMVQCSQEVFDANPNSTWRRTFIRNVSPLVLRVANWVLESIPSEDRPMTGEEIAILVAKWLPANIAILFLVSEKFQIRYFGSLILIFGFSWLGPAP